MDRKREDRGKKKKKQIDRKKEGKTDRQNVRYEETEINIRPT